MSCLQANQPSKIQNKILSWPDGEKLSSAGLFSIKTKLFQFLSDYTFAVSHWLISLFIFFKDQHMPITNITHYVCVNEFKRTLMFFTRALSEELVVYWPMDVMSDSMQKMVISNTTFEGNMMITIEVWQTILANKMIKYKCRNKSFMNMNQYNCVYDWKTFNGVMLKVILNMFIFWKSRNINV